MSAAFWGKGVLKQLPLSRFQNLQEEPGNPAFLPAQRIQNSTSLLPGPGLHAELLVGRAPHRTLERKDLCHLGSPRHGCSSPSS